MTLADFLDPVTIKQIAELPVGWHTSADVAWSVGGDDPDARRDVGRTLEALYDDGRIQRMYVFNKGRPQPCFLVDNSLSELTEELAR